MIPIGYNYVPTREHPSRIQAYEVYMSPLGNKSQRAQPLRTPIDLGALIKRRRKALGLTQIEFADQAGVGRRFLIELENGKPTAQIGKALHVLSMLGVTLTAAEA